MKGQLRGLETVVRSELSVRATEQLAKDQGNRASAKRKSTAGDVPKGSEAPWKKDLMKKIERSVGLPVELHCTDDLQGRLVIKFHGREQLDVLIERVAPTAEL